MTATVTDRDNGYKALFNRLARQNQGRVVDVGVIGSKAAGIYEGTGLTVADVASFHEFGRGVPERSFIRAYVDEHRNEIEDLLRKTALRVISGELRSFDQGLNLVGLKIQGEIQNRMISRPADWPDMDEDYAEKYHGGNVRSQLQLHGQLINSITYELRRVAEAM